MIGSDNMINANNGGCVSIIAAKNKVNFKGMCLQDGPAGVRYAKGTGFSWQEI